MKAGNTELPISGFPEIHPDFRDEVRAPSSLRPSPHNARTHSDAQVRHLADLIVANGWTFPPLVDEDGTIIAGEGRWRAALLLGLAEMPVRVAIGWSDEQKRIYILADNRVAAASGWDDELLAIELGALADMGADLELAGFDADELAALLGPAEADVAGAKIARIETSAVADVFWIQVSGPLASQADVLQQLQAIERAHPTIAVRLGTTPREASA